MTVGSGDFATFLTALMRAAIIGFFIAGVTFFTAFATTDDNRVLIAVTGASFFGTIVSRGGIEGAIDQHRAATNDQSPADVGFGLLPKEAPRG